MKIHFRCHLNETQLEKNHLRMRKYNISLGKISTKSVDEQK